MHLGVVRREMLICSCQLVLIGVYVRRVSCRLGLWGFRVSDLAWRGAGLLNRFKIGFGMVFGRREVLENFMLDLGIDVCVLNNSRYDSIDEVAFSSRLVKAIWAISLNCSS